MLDKIKLDVDQLAVESFNTAADEQEERGTVQGYQFVGDTAYDRTCNGYGTCGIYPCKPIP